MTTPETTDDAGDFDGMFFPKIEPKKVLFTGREIQQKIKDLEAQNEWQQLLIKVLNRRSFYFEKNNRRKTWTLYRYFINYSGDKNIDWDCSWPISENEGDIPSRPPDEIVSKIIEKINE